ncbi:MAG: class F sortase [Labedaea sp.]
MEANGPERAGPRHRGGMAGATVLTIALSTVLLSAGAGTAPAEASSGAFLRLAHLSPDTPAVDVTVTPLRDPKSATTINGVGYGDVSGYSRIDPGGYTIAMRPAGAAPTTKPVISATLDAAAGRAYTVAGLGHFADLALRVLEDEIGLPPSGQARMRVVNAAPLAGDLTIRREGTAVIEHTDFGQASSYVLLPAGPTTLNLAPRRAADTSLPVTLDAGGVYSVLVLERNGTLSATVRQDAKGARVVPAGGVATGAGGTASSWPAWDPRRTALIIAVVAAILAGAVLTLGRRNAAPEAAGVAPPPAAPSWANPTADPIQDPVSVARPVRLRIPAIGVDSPVVDIGVDAAGVLVPPVAADRVGWFTAGPAPGDTGPALLAAHVDSRTGPGVFFRLADLRAGDRVAVERADGSTAGFAVVSTKRVAKTAFPTELVYAPLPVPLLRLITCGGEFDRTARSYLDNVIVEASPV